MMIPSPNGGELHRSSAILMGQYAFRSDGGWVQCQVAMLAMPSVSLWTAIQLELAALTADIRILRMSGGPHATSSCFQSRARHAVLMRWGTASDAAALVLGPRRRAVD
jgi:hypothetical protein